MTILLELTPAQEARLRETAAQQGKEPAAILTEMLDTLPEPEADDVPDAENQRLIATLKAWIAEDANQTEEKRDESEALWQDFYQGIAAARREQGQEPLFRVEEIF